MPSCGTELSCSKKEVPQMFVPETGKVVLKVKSYCDELDNFH